MIKYILFDFDGTLADSKEVFISIWNQLSEKYKYKKIKYEEIEEMQKLSIKERCKHYNFSLLKIPIMAPEFYKRYQVSIKDVILFDGIKELLDGLNRRGYKMAIISSNSANNIQKFLENNQINHVEEILCSSKIFGKDKIIKKFLHTRKLDKSEVIYIGDEVRDIEACEKSGVPIIWAGWGYDAIELVQKKNPDYMAHSPQEVLNIVGAY
ncbi:HAD-IA family hydrolase [Bacillus sp. 165]|uniref:HAD-IA family hydrolase n=1 Tax=Bacillus sp. 165 TaxID=1529117 RepID=UPI001ADCF669|nr:HAD-IA family hydrolase [Bacillus sp. 165]MBO9130926.1 HAD-IA family hydrolase [Bacillus sp. 165]